MSRYQFEGATPEKLAKALLRPVKQGQENSEDAVQPKAVQHMIQEEVKEDPEIR